jgi:hypothetical protein
MSIQDVQVTEVTGTKIISLLDPSSTPQSKHPTKQIPTMTFTTISNSWPRPNCDLGPQGFDASVKFSPLNGRGLIAYSDMGSGGLTLYDPDNGYSIPIHQLDTLGINGEDYYPKWSPDGKRIAFIHYSSINGSVVMSADLEKGEICPISESFMYAANDLQNMVWSPDGNKIILRQNLGYRKNELLLFTLATGKVQNITSDIDGPVQWIDDNRIAYIMGDYEKNKWELLSRSINENDIRVIISEDHPIYDFDYSPDGQWLAYSDGNVNIINLTKSTRKIIQGGEYVPRYDGLAWSPNSKYLLIRAEEGQVLLYQIAQLANEALSLTHGIFTYDSWSPDSTRFIVTIYSVGIPGKPYLVIFEINTKNNNRIYYNDHSLQFPSWNIA